MKNNKSNYNTNILLRWPFRSITAYGRSSSVAKFLAKLASIFVTFLRPFWVVIFFSLLTTPTFLNPSLHSTIFWPASLSSC